MTTDRPAPARRRAYVFLDGAEPADVLAHLGSGAGAALFKDYVEAQLDDSELAAVREAGHEVYCAPVEPQPADTPPAAGPAALAADAGEGGAAPRSAAGPPPSIPRVSKRDCPRLKKRFARLAAHAPVAAGGSRLRVRLRGSLTEDRRRALEKAGATIDSLRGGYYQVHAAPGAQPAIGALPFVAELRDYDLLDTVTTDLLQDLATDPGGRGTFDAQAHSQREVDGMLAGIAALPGVEIVSRTRTTVRFTAPYDDRLLATVGVRPDVMVLNPVRPAGLMLDRVRRLIGAESVAEPPPAGLGLTGGTEIIGIIDSGIMSAHPDFAGRIHHLESYDGCSVEDLVGHGTHVAGIAAGSGAASQGKVTGVAPEARLVIVAIADDDGKNLHLPADLGELFRLAYDQGARIINCSWAKPLSGIYDPSAYSVDDFVRSHPDLLLVMAAGNEGNALGGEHALRTVGSPATAKNIVTVGASGTDRADFDETWIAYASDRFPVPLGDARMSPSIDEVALLSSAGPTDSNGVKPDVTAPGLRVLAPRIAAGIVQYGECDQYDGRYGYLHGTSMAAPAVAGAAALLRQYVRGTGNQTPSAALLKALLVNATRRLPPAVRTSLPDVGYPDFDQGYGRVDLATLLPAQGAPAGRAILTAEVANGDADEALTGGLLPGSQGFSLRSYGFVVTGAEDELRVSIAWTDVPGNGLQNDIQLVVTTPDNRMIVGNPEHRFDRVEAPADSMIGSDRRNTIEQVRLVAPQPGQYRARVWARNTLKPRQGYALVVCGQVEGPLAPLP